MISAEDWPVVIIESPYAPPDKLALDTWERIRKAVPMRSAAITFSNWYQEQVGINMTYLSKCCLDAIAREEVPYASHGFFTHFLDDTNSLHREVGMTAGYAMWRGAKCIALYTDKGISPGMARAEARAVRMGIPVEYRYLNRPTKESSDG